MRAGHWRSSISPERRDRVRGPLDDLEITVPARDEETADLFADVVRARDRQYAGDRDRILAALSSTEIDNLAHRLLR